MRQIFFSFLLSVILFIPFTGKSDEGMWLPLLISRYNMADMQKLGLKLTAEQIYSVNQACLKDAIVSLDHGGCTGSIISEKGLLITNHHCGFEDIAGQSSVNHDYLTEGFWAMRPDEELPIPGKTVSFLLRMEDVTELVLAALPASYEPEDREKLIQTASDSLVSLAITDTHYEAKVERMFEGNAYYLFVYETFKDIRMVGAPPSGIGKFGGETDNWMWPRHTGDFCLLRVYASSDGKPADFAKGNVPFRAKHTLPVSLKGVKEGDFSMILGYPGLTDRYLTSYGIRQKLDQLNPAEILLKTAKMDILKKYMKQSDALRIAYASDYAYLANFQKKAIQESKALNRLRVADDKKLIEDRFNTWAQETETRKEVYGNVISELDTIYDQKTSEKADLAISYLEETLMGAKILYWAYQSNELLSSLEDGDDLTEQTAYFRQKAEEFYRNYDPEADREIMHKMFELYHSGLPDQFYPEFFSKVDKKYGGDFGKYTRDLYDHSLFSTPRRFEDFLSKPSARKLAKDPVMKAAMNLFASYIMAMVLQSGYEEQFNEARRKFIAGLQEMDSTRKFYPDANSTMRLTYGQVMPYSPADAVDYDFRTTYKGILEKDNPDDPEFRAPARLETLLKTKDFGRYAENGILPVCFLTTHDITGGNSGSPVMNADGELIGLAFDGNSEAMSSDIKYDVALQRTICVDIRYVLFVIDKYAEAGYLLDEMKISE